MDGECGYEDFRSCLRSLEQVNRWLLGYRPTLAWLKRLPHGLRDPVHIPLNIVDVGSGGGDLLRRIASWGAGGSGVHSDGIGHCLGDRRCFVVSAGEAGGYRGELADGASSGG
jgi:hypothetical protein